MTKASAITFLIACFTISFVSSEMATSPVQFRISQKMMEDVIKSSKSDILQVYDNLTITPEDGSQHFKFDLK